MEPSKQHIDSQAKDAENAENSNASSIAKSSSLPSLPAAKDTALRIVPNDQFILDMEGVLQSYGYVESLAAFRHEVGGLLNLETVENLTIAGQLDALVEYMLRFTKPTDNGQSETMFLEINRERFYESIAIGDLREAVTVLRPDLHAFKKKHPVIYKACYEILADEIKPPLGAMDRQNSRLKLFVLVRRLLKSNPLFKVIKFPR